MKNGRMARNIALIVASLLVLAPLAVWAAEPPPGLLKKIADRETENAKARQNYTYRQSVTIQEFNDQGIVTGQYYEVHDITFSPNRVRYEQEVEKPKNTLSRIRLDTRRFRRHPQRRPVFAHQR